MFSVKIALNERVGLLRRSREYFQSLNAGQRGALNFDNQWTPNAALQRDAYFFGNLRYLASKQLIPSITLVT
jgi:hypothetical protein